MAAAAVIVGGADIDALGGNVDVAGGGKIAAGLAVGAAGIYPHAAFFNQPEIGCPGIVEFTVQRTKALFDHITGFR